MIEYFTGSGGISAMFAKLKEVYNFKKVVCESEDETAEDAIWRLWVSDEVSIRYQGGAGHGWADMCNTGGICEPFIPVVTAADERVWKIVKTSKGAAFGAAAYGAGNLANSFIATTIDASGKASAGLASRNVSGTLKCVTDGMTDYASNCPSHWGTAHWTQIVPLITENTQVRFDGLYFVGTALESSNREISLEEGVFFCNVDFALKDE